MNLNDPSHLDQHIGSLLEAWINRPVDDDQCRFCNATLDESAPPDERYCNSVCESSMEAVLDARIEIGSRDLEQRGYD
jgi:hypothetical protein